MKSFLLVFETIGTIPNIQNDAPHCAILQDIDESTMEQALLEVEAHDLIQSHTDKETSELLDGSVVYAVLKHCRSSNLNRIVIDVSVKRPKDGRDTLNKAVQ